MILTATSQDLATEEPTVPISLADLISKTGGVNPFELPAGTLPADPRVQALTNVRFKVGIKICMGLPPGAIPVNLPLILEPGSDIRNVTFSILCSDFDIVLNVPPGSTWAPSGSWNVLSQPLGSPWVVKTKVNLISSTLDNQLRNSVHFQQNPNQKQQLLNQLQNISGSAFSLQQTLSVRRIAL
jgi:hypothetical protein